MKTVAPKRGRQLVDFEQYGFSGGINIQDSPQELADSDLTSAVNVYLETAGDVSMRRGVTTRNTGVTGQGGAIGGYRFYQNIASGMASSNVITLEQVGASLYNADTGALIGTAGQLGAATPMSVARIFDPQRNGGTDILVICTGSGGPYAYDGTTLYTFPGAPTTVTSARWCIALNNVLYFSGIPSQPNLVVASGPGLPESLPGYATFTTTYPVTGLGILGQGLQSAVVIGEVQGFAILTGFTPLSYTEQEIPNQDGVTGGLTMICVDGILYFVGSYAIYRYDGASLTEISRKVRPWILNDPNHQEYPMNGNRQLSWSMYYNRRIYFWYCSNSAIPNVALVYHLETNGWSIYQGAQNFQAGCALNAPSDGQPIQFAMFDAVTGAQYNFDVFADATLSVSDNGISIAASFTSKYFKIGSPGTPKTLMRFSTETFCTLLSGLYTIQSDFTLQPAAFAASSPGSLNNSIWDVSNWDNFDWAGSGVQYLKQRQDCNIFGEAFSFGFMSPNPATPQPSGATVNAYQPWRYMGVTGRVSQNARNN